MGRLLDRLRPGRRRVTAGRGVRLGRDVRLHADPGARIVLGDGCAIGDGTRLEARGDAVLRIGAGARIGARCVLVAHAGIDVGERAVLGEWAAILDAEPVFADAEAPTRAQGIAAVPVRIAPGAVVDHAARVLAGADVHTRVEPGTTVPAPR